MAWPEIKLEMCRAKGKNSGLKGNWKFALAILFAAKLLAPFASAAPFGEFSSVAINGAVGNSRTLDGVFHLKSSGTNNGIVFVSQPFSWNGEISARVRRTAQTPKVGVLFRENTNTVSASAGMFLSASNTIFERQINAGQTATVTTRTNETWEWLRVVREGNAFSGFYSADGTNWTQISADTIEMPKTIFAGLAISGTGEAEVKDVRMTSAHLTSPPTNGNFIAPTNIMVEVEAESFGGEIKRIEFFSGTEPIKEMPTAPYAFLWTNVLAGSDSITAKIIGDSGAEFFTEPVNYEIKLREASVTFMGVDQKTKGNWKGVYGKTGFLIVNDQTNLPSGIQLKPQYVLPFTWPGTAATEQRALLRAESEGRIISSWNYSRPIRLDLSLADGSQQRLTLYFLDCDKKGRIMDVQIWSAAGKLLDRQTVGSFIEGKYLTWLLRGKVIIKIASIGPSNPIVSALFFDPTQ